MIHRAKTVDMYNGKVIAYPQLSVTFRYDFVFTKNNRWFYNTSYNDLDNNIIPDIKKAVEDSGNSWRVINPTNREIVQSYTHDRKKTLSKV